MKKLLVLVSAVTALAGMNCFAQQTSDVNTTNMKLPDVQESAPAKQDIDDEITNARLRAQTGAKSPLSVSTAFSYLGAALTDPLSTKRPQLNVGQAAADPTNLSGTIALKYRLTEHDALNFGTGVSFTPAHGNSDGSTQPNTTNISTPYVDYNRTWKSGILQNVLDLQVQKYTYGPDVNSDPNSSNLNSQLSASYTFMAGLGKSKAEVGAATFITEELYNNNSVGTSGNGTLYQIGIEPILEYAFSDKMSFRTVYRAAIWTTKTGSPYTAGIAPQTESVGIGYALTRDVYLYPNLQWNWTAISANQTTVGFSTYINL